MRYPRPSGRELVAAQNEQTLNTFYNGSAAVGLAMGGGFGDGMATTTTESNPKNRVVRTVHQKLFRKSRKESEKSQRDINDLLKKFRPKSNG